MNKEVRLLYTALVDNDTICLSKMIRKNFNMSETVFLLPGWSVKYTPLQFVASKGKLETVQFLLENGVNPNVRGIQGETPLIISIKAGFHKISKTLIVRGANTCKPDINGKTPLYWAVDKRNQVIINLLLDYGAELMIHTALLYAIDSNYLDMVKLLVKRGAPVNVVSSETPLIRAIKRGYLDIAKFLIESGANVNPDDEYGKPLNIAIREKCWDIVNILIERGARVNLSDVFGNVPAEACLKKHNFEVLTWMIEKGLKVDKTLANTALVWSLEMEKVNLVKYFIGQGADVHQKYKNGQTLLSIALKNFDLRSFRLLIESGADPRLVEAEIKQKMAEDYDFAVYMKLLQDETTHDSKKLCFLEGINGKCSHSSKKRLQNALRSNDTTFLTQMIREGFDMSETVIDIPEGYYYNKYTPLQLVVHYGQLPTVQFLLEKGVNPNVRGMQEDTPLLLSIKEGYYEISETLIVRGANTCKPDINGKTPLYWAVHRRNKNIINLLLDHGAELTIHTALLYALDSNCLDMVQLLVERGAPVNLVSSETPLTRAIKQGYWDIAKFLIKIGADVNVNDHQNGRPLNIAIREEHWDIVKFLIESGADVNLTDIHGTPLSIAIRDRCWHIVKFLIESGAKVNLADVFGNVPAEACLKKHNFEVLTWMIEKGFKADATLANTALVWSLEMEKGNLAKYFIKQGADVNQKHNNGQTLLSIALKNSDLRSFQLLIESGADPRLVGAEIKQKMAEDYDFAVYMKSIDPKFKRKQLTTQKKQASTENASLLQGHLRGQS